MGQIYYIDYQDRRYVGETEKTRLLSRILDHTYHGRGNLSPFKGVDINDLEYGCLENNVPVEDLHERETFYINKYDTIRKGWNKRKYLTRQQIIDLKYYYYWWCQGGEIYYNRRCNMEQLCEYLDIGYMNLQYYIYQSGEDWRDWKWIEGSSPMCIQLKPRPVHKVSH